MKSIKFTDLELESMIDMYTDELEEAQMYIAQIQELLKKLGAVPVKAEVVEKEPKVAKKRGRKPSLKPVEVKEPKKRGRKPKVVITEPEIAPEPVQLAANKPNAKKKAKPEHKAEPQKDTATVESVVTSLLTSPKKIIKKTTRKKSPAKKRAEEMAASVKLSKPRAKKVTEVKPVAEIGPDEPGIAPQN